MAGPSLVLFDMDHVLCDYDRGARVAHVAALSGRPEAEVFEAIFLSGFEAQGDSGALDSAAYLRGFGERIGFPLSLDQWVEARRAGTRARPAMLALVRRLRVRAAVLTNNPALVVEHMDRICPELVRLFPGALFASASLGAAKPEAACFERCLAALGVAPGDTLFTDDLAENVDGAVAAGLCGHHFTDVDSLAARLDELGLI